MKAIKFLALMLVALVGMTACSSDDEEKKPEPIIDPVEPVEPRLVHDFKGYIYVSSGHFSESYYGAEATLCVYETGEKQYRVTFSDPTWGDAVFDNVQLGRTLSGTGTLDMVYRGNPYTYTATLSGPMTTPIISIEKLMGGTTITFHMGEEPLAEKITGTYAGANKVMVGDTYGPYEVETTYTISANSDETINISMPEYQLEDLPVMGDMTIGKLTISNIAYDEEKGAFYRTYGADGLTQHCTTTTFDRDFAIAEASYIQIELTEAGVKVTNSFSLGNMPFPIFATFEETVSSAK